MTREIDIIYQPDASKKKLLEFNNPVIKINDKSINISSDGFVSNIILSDTVVISMTTYAYDPLSGTKNQISLDDNEYNYKITFSILPTGGLPSNLSLGDNGNGTCEINGYIDTITSEKYEFLIRSSLNVYTKDNVYVRTDDTDYYMYFTSIKDNTFYWDTNWLDTLYTTTKNINGNQYIIYKLGMYPKGGLVDIGLSLSNISDKVVNFIVSSVDISNSQPTLLPKNINLFKINNTSAKLSGNVDLLIDTSNGNLPYYFNIYADDGTTTGVPDTKSIIFEMDILNYYADDNVSSNTIIWNTSVGNIGTSYERYNSHFSVSAYNPDGKSVTYQVSPNGNGLPSGLTIDSNTGLILGILPSVKQKTIYNFTIRAFCGNNFSDRNFYITILPLFNSKSYFDIEIPFTYFKRVLATSYAWNTDCVPEDKVFRSSDTSFGRLLDPSVYFVGGLSDIPSNTGYWLTTDSTGTPIDRSIIEKLTDQNVVNTYESCFVDKLRNYHKPFDLTINGIDYAPCYDPDGNYIYDVVYLTMTDRDEGDYRYFDNSNTEQMVYTKYEYNSENNERYFKPSIRNCRLDLIETTNRQYSGIFNKRPNTNIGMGFANTENLPLWMLTINPQKNKQLGYICCLPIVYTSPGYGNNAIILYNQNNISELFGITFTVGGYLVNFYHTVETHFDLNTETGTETTFDVVNNDKDNSGTWFDVNYQKETKYILFPEEGN